MMYIKISKAGILAAAILFTSMLLPYLDSPAEARRKAKEDTSRVQPIPFRDFWDKVTEEGNKWAGDKLYIQKITSGIMKGFDRREGSSPFWEAQLVRCDELNETNQQGKHVSICKGKSVIVSMASEGLTGIESGLNVGRMKPFRGAAVSISRISVSALSAEEAADGHMRFRSSGFDNYSYDMKIDRLTYRPLWVIKKACSAKGVTEMRCRSKDHWIIRVDAETGEVLR
jgi:hypothetical protein